jgi:tetratricopeptide (TPR) repeat protein
VNNPAEALALGRFAEAEAGFRQQLALRPDWAEVHNDLGIALAQQGRVDEAITSFQQAVRVRPDYAEAYNNLGVVYNQIGKLDEAVASARQALRLRPGYPEAANTLGNALRDVGRLAEAMDAYQEAIRHKPNYAEAHNNLGIAQARQGKLAEAVASFRQAVYLRPNYAKAYNNLGNVLRDLGYAEEALANYQQALNLLPDYADAHRNRAMAWLQQGNFAQGWPEYEWRWQCQDLPRRGLAQPHWDGLPLHGRTILLYAEQGIGDTLQFVRYASLVQQKGGRVILECQPALQPLLARCRGVEQVVSQGTPLPPFDVQAPLLSLPSILKTTLDSVPAQVPYLFADPELVERWRRELSSLHGFKIGIAWQGNPNHPADRFRSFALAQFAPLAQLEGVQLISLQQGPGEEQLSEGAERWGIIDLDRRLHGTTRSFADTAVVLPHLDLVITVDSAVAHLAGALGVPVWVALPFASDWRWLLHREDSPWYPTMRLFRQKALGNWDEVFARMAAALCTKMTGLESEPNLPEWPTATPSLTVEEPAGDALTDWLNAQTAEMCNNQGAACEREGKYDQAAACYRQALQLKPHFAEAHNNLAVVLEKLGQLDEAAAHYREALRRRPDLAAAYNNLGVVYGRQGKCAEAEASYRRALSLQPDYPEAYNNLGNVLSDQHRFGEAEASYRQAVRLKPDFAPAYHSMGGMFAQIGKLDEALACYEHALQIRPDYADVHRNRAMAWLQRGEFAKGWPEYEWRWRCSDVARRPFRQPRWDGSPLNGLTILLHAEQGMGDTLHFMRYAPLVKQRGGRVILECPPALRYLLARSPGIDQLIPQGTALPDFTVQAPLLSLPGIFQTTLESIPAQVPYVFTDPDLIERRRAELQPVRAFKVGLIWQGNPGFRGDRYRSFPLAQLEPLFRLDGVRFFSLQKGPGTEQLEALTERWQITDLGRSLDETAGPFLDMAAIMQRLDLVITADTMPAHLAGALGVPVWLALPFAPDWRWMLHREDSPWYPTMRLFRQKELGNWDEVFARMAAALEAKLAVKVESAPLATATRSDTQPCLSAPSTTVAEQTGGSLTDWLNVQTADMCNNQGAACEREGKLDEACACYHEALRLHPNFAAAHNNLAIVLEKQGHLDEAIAHYREALRLEPNLAAAYNNLGVVYARQGKLDEAEASYRQAVRLQPDYPDAHNNLGNVLGDQHQFAEALACYERALHFRPDYAEAHRNRGMLWLLQGDFERGWPEFDWRWRCHDFPRLSFPQPRWDGSPLAGRRILLYAEQGLGDTLQFIRYARLVQQRGGQVVVECPPILVQLLGHCLGIDQLVPRGTTLPPFDVQAPLMSLPGILKTTADAVPAQVPYIHPVGDLVERWRAELSSLHGFKIGIAWQGNPSHRGDRYRSFPLALFEPLARLEGVRLLSLQKGPGVEQLGALAERLRIMDLGSRLDDTAGPFLDCAAIMTHLDLVISVDSVLAHLAGALGIPVWVPLPFAPDWRWLLEREDTPWYPTMRLFRQKEPGNWEAVFARMAGELQKMLAGSCVQPVRIEITPGELLDKITILEIKNERITDPAKLPNVRAALSSLTGARDRALPRSEQLAQLTAELKAANETLWQAEDDLRECERQHDFGPRFIELARSVYHTNDRRSAIKRQINELLGSAIIEEESYAAYY